MRDFRDAYTAHNLTLSEPDMTNEENVSRVHYGDETALLKDTVALRMPSIAGSMTHRSIGTTPGRWPAGTQRHFGITARSRFRPDLVEGCRRRQQPIARS
jgi:hypothetical protein